MKNDLMTGGTRLVGGTVEVQELAWNSLRRPLDESGFAAGRNPRAKGVPPGLMKRDSNN